jgi:iron complex outermembrane recepter protein
MQIPFMLHGPAAARVRNPTICRHQWFTIRAVLLALLILLHLSHSPLYAQTSEGTGAISGRVLNVSTGAYLNNARVSVDDTTIVALTDQSGSFVLNNVPAGNVTLRVFFTGLGERLITVTVPAGGVVRQDVRLPWEGADDETVTLTEFVVSGARESSGAAIAVHEQRVSRNIISVVSTDELGTMVDKNPGEALKWLPGVDVEYFANNIVGVSVRGLGAVNTEVNFDGMPVASANAEGVGRNFDVQYASASDIAYVEIRKLPLPQDSANALGGSINLVRRSAFEYSKRQISYQALVTSDGEKLTLDKIDGPKDRLRSRWQPNWEVKWTEPINPNLGFAFTVGQNSFIANTHWSLPGWNRGSAANNTAAEAALRAGQPVPTVPSIYNPAMNNPLNHNAPLMQGKDYASIRADWRPFPSLTLGYSLSGTKGWKEVADDIRFRWNAAQVGSGDVATYNDQFTTVGRTGGGGIYHDNPLWRDIKTPTLTNMVEATWRQGPWTVSGKGVVSDSSYEYFDTARGFFNSSSVPNVTGLVNIGHTGVGGGTANPIPITITYSDQHYWGPRTITAVATTTTDQHPAGSVVDWSRLSEQRIGGARSRPGNGTEIITAAKVFVKREFNLNNPFSLQLGFDFTEIYKDRRYPNHTWKFVGADGVPNSADDSATLIAADHLPARRDSAYNYPAVERISMSKLYQLYQDNPTWFRYDEARSAQLSLTSNPAYELTETTIAPYLQFDWQLLQNRLQFTGGVRFERSDAEARGLLINNSAAYMKYSDGSVVRAGDVGPNGSALVANQRTNTNVNYVLLNGPGLLPAARNGAPIFLPEIQAAGNAARAAGESADTGTNLGRGTLPHTATIYREKGAYAEGSNDNVFPSLHASYEFTRDLVLQVGYAKTQAKNRFDRSVIPHNEIVENAVTSSSGALGRINVRNKDLKPWVADNLEARLSYYTPGGGVVGLGLFTKDITNYQRDIISEPMTLQQATALAEQFPDLGIGPEHVGYELRTWRNTGKARVDGAELEFRQNLDPLLPGWAQGFSVRGSSAYTNLKGQPAGGDFNQLREWRHTLSVGFHRGRFSANIGYIMNGLQVNNGEVTSNGFTAEQVHLPDHMVDFGIEFALTRWARLFIAGSNITDERRKREDQYEQSPDWSRMVQSNTYGVTYTVGITGRF